MQFCFWVKYIYRSFCRLLGVPGTNCIRERIDYIVSFSFLFLLDGLARDRTFEKTLYLLSSCWCEFQPSSVLRRVLEADVTLFHRYLKYLTKKYLKKNSLRDYLRVVASCRESYELKYFSFDDDREEDSGDEE